MQGLLDALCRASPLALIDRAIQPIEQIFELTLCRFDLRQSGFDFFGQRVLHEWVFGGNVEFPLQIIMQFWLGHQSLKLFSSFCHARVVDSFKLLFRNVRFKFLQE